MKIMKSRVDLARYFKSKKFTLGAEIGVADGRYSEILCKEITGLKLICVDPWAVYESCWRTQKYQDNAYNQTREKLKGYNVNILRKTSVEASLGIPDNSLDFVFIDGSHTFDHVMTDLIIWARKVRQGGIVSGHDYYFFSDSGVVEAVNKYVEVHKIELNIIQRNNSNFRDDRQPCWWFVKK